MSPSDHGGESAVVGEEALHSRRIVFPKPGVVELESHEVDDTSVEPYEAVIRTHVTLISPGTELAWLAGTSLRPNDKPASFPRTDIGYANVGTVLAAGTNVGARPGDRVYTMARHTSVARVDTRRDLCVGVPESLPDEEAVFARLATVSMTTLRTTPARGGDAVAVVGLGLVGNLAAQAFATCGMDVTAVDRAPGRRAIGANCGLSVYGPEDLEPRLRRHRLVIEASGSASALPTAVALAANGGEVALVGAPWATPANNVPSGEIVSEIFLRFLSLRSGWEWALPTQPEPLALGSIQQNAVTALDWLAAGRLRVGSVITHRLPCEEAGAAYKGLRDHPDEYLGVVLRWDHDG